LLESPVVLALLYDIHGNLPALEAVLADADEAGAERYLLGGDYALFGAWPAEVVERLRELDATWIRGNVDRWAASPDEAPDELAPAIDACRSLIGAERAGELGALDAEALLDGVRYCHASPLSDLDGFDRDDASRDEELINGATERRIVFGHTHIQFLRGSPAGPELVNPGSVGIPLDGDHRAAYALVDGDGDVRPRRVDYDWAASAAALRERLGEAGEVPARRIEQARMVS
jgi:diadenosine tetraphosphatase ApaH/serine/threonine PP2A family protein phosphatase